MAVLEIKQGYYEKLRLHFDTTSEAAEMLEKVKPHVKRNTSFTITDDVEVEKDEEEGE